MNIYKEIENELNKKLEEKKSEISKEILNVLGISEDYINKKIKHFYPMYIVNKDSLKLAINMDLYSLPTEDIRLIEYLLDTMEEERTLYIGCSGKNELAKLTLRNSNNNYVLIYDNIEDEYNYYFKQNIYQGSISSDLSLINNLLISLGVTKNQISNDDEELVYLYFLTNLSIMITANLQRKNIYLFDNKYISQTPETLESSIEDYFIKFYNLFKDIINLLILDYKSFKYYLGEKNFIEFSRMILSGNTENIEKLIYLMYKNYLEKTSGVIVDIETITASIKKYKKNN